MRREYDGPALDGTEQYITERPVQPGRADDGRTVWASDPDPEGECRTEDVVMPDEVRAAATEDVADEVPRPSEREPVDVPAADDTEQSTLGEWSG